MRINKYKILSFIILHTIALCGCGSYGTKMNMDPGDRNTDLNVALDPNLNNSETNNLYKVFGPLIHRAKEIVSSSVGVQKQFRTFDDKFTELVNKTEHLIYVTNEFIREGEEILNGHTLQTERIVNLTKRYMENFDINTMCEINRQLIILDEYYKKPSNNQNEYTSYHRSYENFLKDINQLVTIAIRMLRLA